MKIVCDSCGAKYSIADEKVAGKIFKIRCKKCSSVLEVRGDQSAAQALGAAGRGEPILDAGWYVVVEGEQRGPLPPIELSQLFAKGSVGLDSYVWKEGFDDWKAASEVPELVQILGGAGSIRPSETGQLATDSTTSIGAGGDLFSDTNGREPTGEIETDGDPLAGLDESPADVDSPLEAPLAAAQEGDGGALGGVSGGPGGGAMGAAPARMTGQRNENSVLFSLSNLQQLASRGGSAGDASLELAPAQPASVGSPASGEGSGLIDIRALAKSTTPGTKTAPSQAVDDLLAIGTSGGASTLGGPLLGPAPMESSEGNRWLWIAGAGIAVIATVGATFAVGMALGGTGDDGLEVAGQAPVEAAPGSNTVATTAQAPAPGSDTTAAIGAPEPDEAAQFEEPDERPLEAPELEEPAVEPTTSTRQRATTTRRTRLRTATTAPTTADSPPPKKRSGNNLDALMDEVVGGSPSGSKKTATTTSKSSSGGSSLPEAPSRNDVKTALQGVSGGVKACKQDSGGTATVDVTFSGSTGRVSRAKITSGPFKGTAVGGCVERAVKRARVPRFKQSSFKVKFPYRL